MNLSHFHHFIYNKSPFLTDKIFIFTIDFCREKNMTNNSFSPVEITRLNILARKNFNLMISSTDAEKYGVCLIQICCLSYNMFNLICIKGNVNA
jgi:hypothetical protein